MKKPVSKADVRAELQQETERFLDRGGEVESIPKGVSGRDPDESPVYLSRRLFIEPPTPRTPVPEVIAAIEARRRLPPRRTPSRGRKQAPQPRRKVIYDDFGEPLRKVWVDED